MPHTYTVPEAGTYTVRTNGDSYLARQNGDGSVHYSIDGGNTWTENFTLTNVRSRVDSMLQAMSRSVYDELIFGIKTHKNQNNLSPFQEWERGLNNG